MWRVAKLTLEKTRIRPTPIITVGRTLKLVREGSACARTMRMSVAKYTNTGDLKAWPDIRRQRLSALLGCGGQHRVKGLNSGRRPLIMAWVAMRIACQDQNASPPSHPGLQTRIRHQALFVLPESPRTPQKAMHAGTSFSHYSCTSFEVSFGLGRNRSMQIATIVNYVSLLMFGLPGSRSGHFVSCDQ